MLVPAGKTQRNRLTVIAALNFKLGKKFHLVGEKYEAQKQEDKCAKTHT